MCCAGLWALGNTAVISSNPGTQWGHCEGHLISGSSESCPWAIPTTWVHAPLIPAPQFAVQIPVSHYGTVKICSVLKFITWQLALGQDRGFGYLQQFAACPRALQEKADLHRKAYFAGAEFTPALWSLPLNDGYLNTLFFFPPASWQRLKTKSVKTNEPPFCIASHLNQKNSTDLGWITPNFQSKRLWVPTLMWHRVTSVTEEPKISHFKTQPQVSNPPSQCSLLHTDNAAPKTQPLHFLRGHIISPYYTMCFNILDEYISRKSFFLRKMLFSLFIYVFCWAPVWWMTKCFLSAHGTFGWKNELW